MDKNKKLKKSSSEIYSILKNGSSLEDTRKKLIAYIVERENFINSEKCKLHPLEAKNLLKCIFVLRNIMSVKNESRVGFSSLNALWEFVRGKNENLNIGFLEEFIHLFRGISGKSGIYSEKSILESFLSVVASFRHSGKKLSGREAAIARSKTLDDFSNYTLAFIKKYPCGMDEKIIKKRNKNAERIMKILGANKSDWDNWKWQIKNVISNSKSLKSLIQLTKEETEAIDLANKDHIPFGITPYYTSLIDHMAGGLSDHAVRTQVIPPVNYVKEVIKSKKAGIPLDFMQEFDTSPVNLVTRRYPMIAILKPYNTCAQICVYCQRNWEIKNVLEEKAEAARLDLEKAIKWFKEHKTITEVLITGGDPFIMADNSIEFIMEKFSKIKHIERIRWGTRTPVVLPQRITNKLVDMLARYHVPGKREIVIVTHFEHPYEITPEASAACAKLKKSGMGIYNQEVFTFENSRRFESVALRKWLRLIGIDPYYNFNTKGKEETREYRVPIARILQERKEEARLMPGIVRTDEPIFNVPRLGKNYLREYQYHDVIMILPDGSRMYEFYPWEINIALTDTYIYKDVSIYEYLQRLEKAGENLKDYKNIWYYY